MKELVVIPPKSTQVADIIRNEIDSGGLAPGERLMTTRKFAERFGVSRQVIESAFGILRKEQLIETRAGCGTFVAARKRVLSKQMIVLFLGGTDDPHARLPVLLPAALQSHGFTPCLFDVLLSYEQKTVDNISSLLAEKPAAVVIDAYSCMNFDLLKNIPDETSLIFIKRYELNREMPVASFILEDFQEAGRIACQKLLESGRRRIAMLSFERRSGWSSDLLTSGVEEVLRENGLELFKYLNCDDPDILLEAELCRGQFPDGFICSADFMYNKVRKKLMQNGLIMGRDFDVIGYGKTPWSEALEFSSIDPLEDVMAKFAVEAIISGKRIVKRATPVLKPPNSRNDEIARLQF